MAMDLKPEYSRSYQKQRRRIIRGCRPIQKVIERKESNIIRKVTSPGPPTRSKKYRSGPDQIIGRFTYNRTGYRIICELKPPVVIFKNIATRENIKY